jgi:ribosomal protein L4
MVKKSVCMMLSKRLADNDLDFVDIDNSKSIKDMRDTMSRNLKGKTLVISSDANIELALRNVPNAVSIDPMKVNIKNIVNNKKILVDNESVKILEDRLTNGK